MAKTRTEIFPRLLAVQELEVVDHEESLLQPGDCVHSAGGGEIE